MRFCVGVFTGIIIAAIAAALIYYFGFLRNDPDLQRKNARQIEEKWEKTKATGDKAVDTIKSVAPPEEKDK
jgi:hypothetical protein